MNAIASAAALVAFGVAFQQGTPPGPPAGPFRSSTSLVEVDVVVQDGDGRFVSGLTADDFEVLEEGTPQPIQHFYLVTESPTPRTQLPDAAVLPRSPDQTGRRVFLLVFDHEHLSPQAVLRLKHDAAGFVNDHFRSADLGGVYVNGALWRNRLTNDRQELLDGIRALTPSLETPARRLAALAAFPRIPGEFEALRIENGDSRRANELAVDNCTSEPIACAQEGGREYVEEQIERKARTYVQDARRAASSTLDVLAHATRNLSRLEGRKTLVLMSEGFFLDDLRAQLPQVAGHAARAGIAIYTLNARGTAGAAGRIMPDASVERGTVTTFGDTSQEGLELLAAETGAVAFRNSDNFRAALDAVAADTSTYYVLAYSPSNSALDGKFRRIVLRTKWAGMQVRARRGYVATPLPPRRAVRRSAAL